MKEEKELDFSVQGMIKLRLYEFDSIYDLLLWNTFKVRSALYRAYSDNPLDGAKLIKHFISLVNNHLRPPDKIIFSEKWRMAWITGLKYKVVGDIDKKWEESINNWIDYISENARDNIDFAIDMSNIHLNENPSEMPEKSFKEYLMVNAPEKFIEEMMEELQGKKTKYFAGLIIALNNAESISHYNKKALYEAMKNQFGEIGAIGRYNGFSDYLKEDGEKRNNLNNSGIIEYFGKKIKSYK
jgi:hypothetical protein